MNRTARVRSGLYAALTAMILIALCLVASAQPTTASPARGKTGADSRHHGSAKGRPMAYTNPIGDLGHDPFVAQQGQYYYPIESWSGGFWITKSLRNNLTDIVKGQRVKVWSYSTIGPNCRDFWAPELHLIDGHWYIYYAATSCDGNKLNRRMFALRSAGADPMGPYTEAGMLTDSTNMWAIDGTRFRSGGSSYFVWSGWPTTAGGRQDLYIAKMASPTSLTGARVHISAPDLTWERVGMPTNEGPQVLQRNGKVFIVYSASGSWTDDYGYGRLTNSTGDFLNPAAWVKSPTSVFSKTTDVFGPGHGNFFTSPDGREDWMVYHSRAAPAPAGTES